MLDSTFIKVHQHGCGGKKGDPHAIGTSRGGKTTKIHMLCGSCGLPIFFVYLAETPTILNMLLVCLPIAMLALSSGIRHITASCSGKMPVMLA